MMDGKVIVVRSDQSNHCEGECQLVPEKKLELYPRSTDDHCDPPRNNNNKIVGGIL